MPVLLYTLKRYVLWIKKNQVYVIYLRLSVKLLLAFIVNTAKIDLNYIIKIYPSVIIIHTGKQARIYSSGGKGGGVVF